jgi:hypothetical protein
MIKGVIKKRKNKEINVWEQHRMIVLGEHSMTSIEEQ